MTADLRTNRARATDSLEHLFQPLWLRTHVQVTVTEPPPGIVVERDVDIPMRDAINLRVNVFRPDDDQPHPVLMCAHPYGKDAFLKHRRFGDGYRTPQQHVMPQSQPMTYSALTTWEAPDPAHWVSRGYVVVNADLRGWGHSEGVGELLSEQEGLDGHDLIEWAAEQPWSTGRVGMLGVSYLAISQWATAAARPPHLAAICPWEGFTDAYRDFARPGGVRENGFIVVWSAMLRAQRRSPATLSKESKGRPLFDDWWAARNRDLEAIDVPALVCGSYSDHGLHSAGSFAGYERIRSEHKWLYTHRGPKWATFYSPAAMEFQERFFGHFLKDEDTGILAEPPVRIEVREDADTVVDVRGATAWPPPDTEWVDLHLDAADATGGALRRSAPDAAGTCTFDTRRGHVSFTHTFDRDTELVGPMVLRVPIELQDCDDLSLFAGVRKFRHGEEVGFEGSYGYTKALVTYGLLKASHRAVDAARSRPWAPFHPHTSADPVPAGEIVTLDVPLPPSATLFRAGEQLRLDLQGHWFLARNPVAGQFPGHYAPSGRGVCVVHTGGGRTATLTVPVSPCSSA